MCVMCVSTWRTLHLKTERTMKERETVRKGSLDVMLFHRDFPLTGHFPFHCPLFLESGWSLYPGHHFRAQTALWLVWWWWWVWSHRSSASGILLGEQLGLDMLSQVQPKLSLVPRPSHRPVFDRLQYAKMEGEGLVSFITWMTSVST